MKIAGRLIEQSDIVTGIGLVSRMAF